MPDVILTPKNDRTYIEAVTEKGAEWLLRNMLGKNKNSISSQVTEDFALELRLQGLDVEVR